MNFEDEFEWDKQHEQCPQRIPTLANISEKSSNTSEVSDNNMQENSIHVSSTDAPVLPQLAFSK